MDLLFKVDGPGSLKSQPSYTKSKIEKVDVNGETKGGGGETEGGEDIKKRHESDSLETTGGGDDPPADYEEESESDSDFEEGDEGDEGLSDVKVRKQQIKKDKVRMSARNVIG